MSLRLDKLETCGTAINDTYADWDEGEDAAPPPPKAPAPPPAGRGPGSSRPAPSLTSAPPSPMSPAPIPPRPAGPTTHLAPRSAAIAPAAAASAGPKVDEAARLAELTRALFDPATTPAQAEWLVAELVGRYGVPKELLPSGIRFPAGGYNRQTFTAVAQYLGAVLQSLESGGGAIPPAELSAVKARVGGLKTFYDNLITTDGPHTPTGAAVVTTALYSVGRVQADSAGAREGNRATRRGYEHLTEIFDTAFNGIDGNMRDIVKFHDRGRQSPENPGGLPSWCGIFCNYAMKKAGVDIGKWGQFNGLIPKAPSARVPPGSIVACKDRQHYCIVLADYGTHLVTIDGNIGGGAVEVGRRRAKDDTLYGYFALPAEPQAKPS